MRCATCGTENAPDSRFCGGCGAKLAPASRVAPTAKIPDDASYPSQPPHNVSTPPLGAYASGPASIPPQNHAHGPASIPPQNAYPAVPGSIPPQNAYAAAAPGSIPPSNNPASVPPQSSFQRAATPIQTPPPGALKLPTPPPGSLSFAATPREGDPLSTSQRPPISTPDASRSLVVPPRRPIGLMVFVLLVDLALAGAGAMLLGKGLSEKKAAEKPVQKTQRAAPMQPAAATLDTPAATTNATATNAAATNGVATNGMAKNAATTNVEARAANLETSSGAKVATAAPAAATTTKTAAAATTKTAAAATTTNAAAATTKNPAAATTTNAAAATAKSEAAPAPTTAPAPPPAPAPTPAPAPAQPPAPAPVSAAVSLDTQLDRATAASKPAFDRCAADAGSPHGSIRIAFRVLVDGSVANAFPVEDSTGSPSLGACLAQTITTWRFAPDPAQRAPINSLRAFNYP